MDSLIAPTPPWMIDHNFFIWQFDSDSVWLFPQNPVHLLTATMLVLLSFLPESDWTVIQRHLGFCLFKHLHSVLWNKCLCKVLLLSLHPRLPCLQFIRFPGWDELYFFYYLPCHPSWLLLVFSVCGSGISTKVRFCTSTVATEPFFIQLCLDHEILFYGSDLLWAPSLRCRKNHLRSSEFFFVCADLPKSCFRPSLPGISSYSSVPVLLNICTWLIDLIDRYDNFNSAALAWLIASIVCGITVICQLQESQYL